MYQTHFQWFIKLMGGNEMEHALISFSFDDARADNYAAFNKVLFLRNIPVTLNVTTGYVDGSCLESNKPCAKPALTKSQVIELSKNPLVEIALHGDNHLNTVSDISVGRDKLIKWFEKDQECTFGFASPGSQMSVSDFISTDEQTLMNYIVYMRHSLRIFDKHTLRVFARKVCRVTHFPFLYKVAYKNTIMHECSDRVIYAVPVLKDTSVNELISLIKQCVKEKGALVLMFHSIVDDVTNEDNWSWATSKFEALCDYIKYNRITTCTTMDMYNQLVN